MLGYGEKGSESMKIELKEGKAVVVFEKPGEICALKRENDEQSINVYNKEDGLTMQMNTTEELSELTSIQNNGIKKYKAFPKEEIVGIIEAWLCLFKEIFESYYTLSEEVYDDEKIVIDFTTSLEYDEKITIIMSLGDQEKEYRTQLRVPDCNIGVYLLLRIFTFLQDHFVDDFLISGDDYKVVEDDSTRVVLNIQDNYYGLKQLISIYHMSRLTNLFEEENRRHEILASLQNMIRDLLIGIPFSEDIENTINQYEILEEDLKQLHLKSFT